MAKKRKAEEHPKAKIKIARSSKADKKKTPASKKDRRLEDSDDSDADLRSEQKRAPKREELDDDDMGDDEHHEDFDPTFLPPADVLSKLLDRIEAQLPKEDHVKYDSRAKKLSWEKIAFDALSPSECQRIWYYIQDRIRRFRILAELIPDARTWIVQPWTNFYKSKDHNRHPDMPKKPLSMYMLFYSEQRAEILEQNTSLSMPEVAKLCSEKYQKLSEKKKNKYKSRCDQMRKDYEEKLERFYRDHPELRPVKPEKTKRPPAMGFLPQAQFSMTGMPNQNLPQAMLGHATHLDMHGHTHGHVATGPIMKMSAEDKVNSAYPNAPERPVKPFDLFFKSVVDEHINDPGFDRQSMAEKCRQEWRLMKLKKKAKWIRKAADNYRDYEILVGSFIKDNPGFVAPEKKNFLTQDDQKILDKFMGRPEKPPSSAYSLFSKEMLNNPEIKKFPSKERMAQISEKWKLLSQDHKDRYQAQVNDSMSIYRQQYEQWFSSLGEEERKAETARMNTSKSTKKPASSASSGASSAMTATTIAVSSAPLNFAQMTPMKMGKMQIMQTQPIFNTAPTFVMASAPIMAPAPLLAQAQSIRGPMLQPQMQPQPQQQPRDLNKLRENILKREPVEPAKSPRQLFVNDWLQKHKKKKPTDAKTAWKNLDRADKKKWAEKLEPQRQKYIEAYTVFVRALNKEELELYTELKSERDKVEEARSQAESSDSEDSESSESESESDSESDSD